MSNQPTVFVIDDDRAARESVVALVQAQGLPVETFASAEEFLAAYDPARPGCLVTDVRMTGMSGLDLLAALAAQGTHLPVIVITGFANIPTAVRAMQAGAFTFLEKPCIEQDLWNSIRQALDVAADRRQSLNRQADVRSRYERLSGDERKVMREMLAGKANKVIASSLDIGLRTVELRRANVLKKMAADSLAELVRMAIEIWGDLDAPRQ